MDAITLIRVSGTVVALSLTDSIEEPFTVVTWTIEVASLSCMLMRASLTPR